MEVISGLLGTPQQVSREISLTRIPCKVGTNDRTTWTAVEERQVWNPDFAFAYGCLAVGPTGDVGYGVAVGGPKDFPNSCFGILGDLVVYFRDTSTATAKESRRHRQTPGFGGAIISRFVRQPPTSSEIFGVRLLHAERQLRWRPATILSLLRTAVILFAVISTHFVRPGVAPRDGCPRWMSALPGWSCSDGGPSCPVPSITPGFEGGDCPGCGPDGKAGRG